MALGQTLNLAAGAVSDLFAARGHEYRAQGQRLRAQGQRMEAEQYDRSAIYARRNKEIVRNSTEIKTLQEDRKIFRTIGGQSADVAASGFANAGSAIDIMRASAAEGALTKQVLAQQGVIEETSLEQQAESYDVMARSSRLSATMSEIAARAEDEAARGARITGTIRGVSAAISGVTDIAALFI